MFYVNVRKRGPQWTPKIETHFYIKLREDNKFLLEEVKEFFGCGAVYYRKENRPHHSSCYRFEINSCKEVMGVIIPFFERYPLRGTKQTDFVIFREIALALARIEQFTEEGLDRITDLKLQMKENRTRWMRENRLSSGEAK